MLTNVEVAEQLCAKAKKDMERQVSNKEHKFAFAQEDYNRALHIATLIRYNNIKEAHYWLINQDTFAREACAFNIMCICEDYYNKYFSP